MLEFKKKNYLVIDIKEILKFLSKNKHQDDLDFPRIEKYTKGRSYASTDLVAIIGECKLVKSEGKYDRKFVVVCDDAILYDNNFHEETIIIQKLRKKNIVLFSQRKLTKNNFDDVCEEIMKYPYIQETTEEGYRECLGPEIGSSIKSLINSSKI